jgi:hypothetical protein
LRWTWWLLTVSLIICHGWTIIRSLSRCFIWRCNCRVSWRWIHGLILCSCICWWISLNLNYCYVDQVLLRITSPNLLVICLNINLATLNRAWSSRQGLKNSIWRKCVVATKRRDVHNLGIDWGLGYLKLYQRAARFENISYSLAYIYWKRGSSRCIQKQNR